MFKQEKNNLIQNKENSSLKNLENYNKTLDFTNKEIIKTYTEIIIEFIKFVFENIETKNANNYSNFMIFRGLDTITHVFHNLLYHTKNLVLTSIHTQKSFYFYLEFIEQINQEQHIFLQLSSRDATMYVYKKTIFEINKGLNNKEIKEDCSNYSNDNNHRFVILFEITKIMRLLVTLFINYHDKNIKLSHKFFSYDEKTKSDFEYLTFLFSKIYEHEFYDIIKINHINRFINITCLSDLTIKNMYEVIYIGLKKILKNDSKTLEKIENFILYENLNNDNIDIFYNKFL